MNRIEDYLLDALPLFMERSEKVEEDDEFRKDYQEFINGLYAFGDIKDTVIADGFSVIDVFRIGDYNAYIMLNPYWVNHKDYYSALVAVNIVKPGEKDMVIRGLNRPIKDALKKLFRERLKGF